MKIKWEFYPDHDTKLINDMIQQLKIPKPLAKVLCNRGLDKVDEIREFLMPECTKLHDPFLLKDMEKAVDRITLALRERERIMVFGDYDVDGVTSIALVYKFLKDLGGDVLYFVPDRNIDGYGLSLSGLALAKEKGCNLVISVDCGITSIAEVQYANSNEIDVIITDHHEPGDVLPDAVAIVDPKQNGCMYPFKDLAGVGVAYKLAQGILMKLEMDLSYVEKYLDLVAVGSAADFVPIVSENRIFVKLGLRKLNSEGSEGLLALAEVAGVNQTQITVNNVVFGLAPRLNAVGRLGHATLAVELLLTKNYSQALRIARTLEEENEKRKLIDKETLNNALEKIESECDPNSDNAIILAGENWHQGVIGIVASRIIERFHRPTVMISLEDGIGKGSARSIPGFDLHAALQSCSDLFIQFGGHKYAAGLTIKEDNIPEFRNRFMDIAEEFLSNKDMIPRIKIDDVIELGDVTYDLVMMIDKLAPFGPGNNLPIFASYGVNVVGEPRIVGSNHLKFKVSQNGIYLDAIAFNRGEDKGLLQQNRFVNIAFYAEENVWMNKKTLQLRIKDIQVD